MGQIFWNTDVNAPGCPGEIQGERRRDRILIQTDWDYPATAQTFGWSLRDVQNCNRRADFEFGVECGVLVCEECREPFYPMEVDDGQCPECGGHCVAMKVCDHDSTDGTVDCKVCGVTALEFITAADQWLRDNDGATADDPGYFA